MTNKVKISKIKIKIHAVKLNQVNNGSRKHANRSKRRKCGHGILADQAVSVRVGYVDNTKRDSLTFQGCSVLPVACCQHPSSFQSRYVGHLGVWQGISKVVWCFLFGCCLGP
jgi:hypothetical protein